MFGTPSLDVAPPCDRRSRRSPARCRRPAAPAPRSAQTSSRCSARRRPAARACRPSPARRRRAGRSRDSPRLLNGAKLQGGWVRLRRLSSRPGDRVREQRAAGDRAGDDLGLLRAARPAARRADPARSARSSTDGETADADSGTRGRDSRCRSRSARRASAPRTAAILSAFSRSSVVCPRAQPARSLAISQRTSVPIDHPAADDRRGDAAAQLPAVERRVLRFRSHRRPRRSSPCRSGARMRDVGRRALGQRAAGHAEDPRRVHRQQLDQPRQR